MLDDSKAHNELAEKAFRAGWMQGWIESGAATPPNPGCVPALPDALRYQGPQAQPPALEATKAYVEAAATGAIEIQPRSGVVYKRVSIVRSQDSQVITVPRLPKNAIALAAQQMVAEHTAPMNNYFDVGMYFFVPDTSERWLDNKKMVVLSISQSSENVAGCHVRPTGIATFDGERPYFIFECASQ